MFQEQVTLLNLIFGLCQFKKFLFYNNKADPHKRYMNFQLFLLLTCFFWMGEQNYKLLNYLRLKHVPNKTLILALGLRG